ncbi:MAG: hypothetical protein JF597_05925 [Streptomyces sp.]|uniref:glycosyl hydrolase family 28-related protein n=1 Tax=Streptomyces sp. TaxID=1931 RepID=UPI0025D07624|nr:glycosyl hydrolase family 28-related protein [Streptomyces sp.]MBW8793131.1 hypothetical protein [Streptomyces sp.]
MTHTSRRKLLTGAAGLGGTALAASVAAATPAAAASGTGAGWLNVKDAPYGALGDDSSDDQPVIQKAINAAGQGGTVYFPPGKYRIASPLRLSLGVTLRGDWNPRFPVRADMADSFLRPDILNPNAVTMVDCRSEWNAQHGYAISGINYSMVVVGCNTDRNGQDGFHVSTSAGGRFIQFVGCLAKRDGKSGTGYSGFSVTGTSAEGVALTACSKTTGRNDDNTGDCSPSYGITTSALNSASIVSVVGGEYVGTTAAFNDVGAAVVRHSGVTADVHDSSGITWDKSDVHMLSGATGTYRDVQFWTRGKNRRWALRATDATESGAGDGSDFVLVRYADDGTTLDTPLTIRRNTGRITLGQSRTTPGVVVDATANPGISLVQTRAAGQGCAVTSADTSSRAFQAGVTGDSVNRFTIEVDGTQTFGPGGSTGRDTSWGRMGTAQVGSADSDIVAGVTGRGLKVKEGADAKMGTLTLNGDSAVTVATSAVTATSRIFLTVQAPGGTPAGVAYVAGRTAGTSFTVKGMAGDTSTVAWLIVEPA